MCNISQGGARVFLRQSEAIDREAVLTGSVHWRTGAFTASRTAT